jgi:hypothetical protein
MKQYYGKKDALILYVNTCEIKSQWNLYLFCKRRVSNIVVCEGIAYNITLRIQTLWRTAIVI